MKNFEKYKKEVYDAIALCNSDKLLVRAGIKFNPFFDDYKEYKNRLFVWLFEEYKAPILDEVEKEYLKSVINPFRNRVTSVRKWFNGIDYQIMISLDHGENLCKLPRFPLSSEMYMGMDSKKWYTLQELGL